MNNKIIIKHSESKDAVYAYMGEEAMAYAQYVPHVDPAKYGGWQFRPLEYECMMDEITAIVYALNDATKKIDEEKGRKNDLDIFDDPQFKKDLEEEQEKFERQDLLDRADKEDSDEEWHQFELRD